MSPQRRPELPEGSAVAATDRPLGYERRFGGGWISGACAVALGVLGVGAVLCIRYPALLTMPDARSLYPLEVVRFLIHLVLVGAFVPRARPYEARQEPAPGAAGKAPRPSQHD